MKRLADVSIDADGDDLVFRVRLPDRLRSLVSSFVALASGDAPKREAAPAVAIDPATKARDEAIAAGYRDEGLSFKQCREKFGCSQKRLQAALKREGVKSRTGGEGQRLVWAAKGKVPLPPRPGVDTSAAAAQDAAIKARYLDDQMSVPQVAASFEPKLSQELVRRSLQRQKVRMRTASQAAELRWAKRDNGLNADPAKALQPAQIPEKAPPSHSPPAKLTAEKPTAPSNKSNAPIARDLRDRDAEIERRYVDELESVTSLAAVFFNGNQAAVRSMLEARGVKLRSRSEAGRIAWDRREKAAREVRPYTPKPKPLAIPNDAPREQVALGEGAGPELKRKGKWGAGAEVIKAQTTTILKQRKKLHLTPEDQQRLVEEHFAKGGAIKVVPPAPAFGADPVKSAVGTGVGGVRKARGPA